MSTDIRSTSEVSVIGAFDRSKKIELYENVVKAAWAEVHEYHNRDSNYADAERIIKALRDALVELRNHPDKDGWITWEGGPCPVALETRVDLSRPDGIQFNVIAFHYIWAHFGDNRDITSYRICPVDQTALPAIESKL